MKLMKRKNLPNYRLEEEFRGSCLLFKWVGKLTLTDEQVEKIIELIKKNEKEDYVVKRKEIDKKTKDLLKNHILIFYDHLDYISINEGYQGTLLIDKKRNFIILDDSGFETKDEAIGTWTTIAHEIIHIFQERMYPNGLNDSINYEKRYVERWFEEQAFNLSGIVREIIKDNHIKIATIKEETFMNTIKYINKIDDFYKDLSCAITKKVKTEKEQLLDRIENERKERLKNYIDEYGLYY